MSLKIKNDDVMWSPNSNIQEYFFEELDCAFSSGGYEPPSHAMEVVFHPSWVEEMNNIDIGDVVTDESGRTGLVMKEEKPKPGMIKMAGVKRFLVSFAGVEEVCHSFVLRKLEEHP